MGAPTRHGAEFSCSDPARRHTPNFECTVESGMYGTVTSGPGPGCEDRRCVSGGVRAPWASSRSAHAADRLPSRSRLSAIGLRWSPWQMSGHGGRKAALRLTPASATSWAQLPAARASRTSCRSVTKLPCSSRSSAATSCASCSPRTDRRAWTGSAALYSGMGSGQPARHQATRAHHGVR